MHTRLFLPAESIWSSKPSCGVASTALHIFCVEHQAHLSSCLLRVAFPAHPSSSLSELQDAEHPCSTTQMQAKCWGVNLGASLAHPSLTNAIRKPQHRGGSLTEVTWGVLAVGSGTQLPPQTATRLIHTCA